MITPRHTRLVRVPDLHSFRSTAAALARQHLGELSQPPLVIVPTQAAARYFSGPATVPAITREELYDALHARLASPPGRLNTFERDALMQAAANMPAEGLPFAIRPGLVAEMVRFYDHLRRHLQTVTRFEELMSVALSGGDADRGAERLLRQTRFLAAAFRRYEAALTESGGCDEHTLRSRLLAEEPREPVLSVIVTVADWIGEPDGLFVADFDLLARLPQLKRLDLICTDAVLGSGFHERIHGWWPGLEETSAEAVAGTSVPTRPRVMTPPDSDVPWFTYRDREEEMIAVARRVAATRSANRTTLVVFKRPLPYLYLAKDVFGAADVAYHAEDALPLAADPGAAIVDLVLDSVEARFTRLTLLAMLRSPYLDWPADQASVRPGIAALDRQLSARRYLGELERLEVLAEGWQDDASRAALDTALAIARDLSALLSSAPASIQLRHLQSVLDRWFPVEGAGSSVIDHERAVRARLRETLQTLAAAHERYHDVNWSIDDLANAVRRAIGDQTFAMPSNDGFPSVRVHLADDRAARYAECAEVTLVGVIDNEWPETPRRNIFYSAGLLKALGWPSEKDRRAAADARFLDLLGSASDRVYVSTVTLDDEALVTRSTELDEIPRARLSSMVEEPSPEAVLNAEDALLSGDAAWPGFATATRGWLDLRLDRTVSDDAVFHGRAGGQGLRMWSVSALETYIDCPFRFFAQHVLRLEEEPDDEEVMDPRRRGRFVHEVFERFFSRWQAEGNAGITPSNIHHARALFTAVVDESLRSVSPTEAGLERTRLLGSSAAAGLGESVFRMEAERPVPVVERRLEFDLRGEFTVATAAGPRVIPLKGRIDRLDLLADGSFRVIDYKLGWPPKRDRALQLPIYAVCAEQRLPNRGDRAWQLGEAMYVAFKGPRRIVPLFTTEAARRDVIADAQQRLADTVDAIDRGEFPPSPDDVFRCETCSFFRVCRKDYV